MPRLQAKSFASPDEVRTVPRGHFDVVKLDETTVAWSRLEPGWNVTEDMAAIYGGPRCPIHHLGYTVSGQLHVVTDVGEELDIRPGTVYEIPPGHDAWVVGDEPWISVDWTSGRTMASMMDTPGERVIATVLFTDIVDSTATIARIGDAAWRDLHLAHNLRLRDELNMFRGREIATTGDGFLALFDSATRAVLCASAMTRTATQLGLAIRVGIHTGEIELVAGDARGLAVHTASRVLSVAASGEVLVSSTTRDLLEGSGIELADAGMHELKGLHGARQLYRLVTAAPPDAH